MASELRETMAEALRAWWTAETGEAMNWHPEPYADALLPVVTAWAERRARERAAEVVHKVARSLSPTQDREANRLHDAADALATEDPAEPR